MKNYSMYIFFVIVITGCTTKKNTLPKVGIANEGESYVLLDKALAKIKEAPNKFTINSSKSQDLKLPTGSSIRIPANAFVDKNGIPIKGKVTIEWSEYHSITDVISSGIPMEYDSLGKAFNLVTGGMFKINGFQRGEEVFISKNKQLEVEIASTDQRRGMNFYSFDEVTQQWKYEATKTFDAKKPQQEEQTTVSESKFVLDLRVSTNRFPELKDQVLLGWKTVHALDQNIKTILEKNSSNTTLSKRLTDSTYLLTIQLYDSRGTSYELEVQPYTYEEGKNASAFNKLKDLKEKQELMDYFHDVASGKIIRTYPIQAFGTYNWDYLYKDSQIVEMIATFQLPKVNEKQPLRLYFVCKEDHAVINLHGLKEKIRFNPNKSNYLIAITEQSDLYSCTPRDFQFALQNSSSGNFQFLFKSTGKKLVDHQEFTTSLNSVLKNN